MYSLHDCELRIYSQRAIRGRKREDRVCLFSEWRVSELWTGVLTETMVHVHPAAFSLLLSLPILRQSICLWAETHGTSCSTQPASQKFTSCSSALLLHTNTIPRTCINGPSCAQAASGSANRQANTSPFYRCTNLHLCLLYTLKKQSWRCVHPTEQFSHYLRSSLERQWKHCVILMMGQGKGGDRNLFEPENIKEWEGWHSHDWHPSALTLLCNTHMSVKVLTVNHV